MKNLLMTSVFVLAFAAPALADSSDSSAGATPSYSSPSGASSNSSSSWSIFGGSPVSDALKDLQNAKDDLGKEKSGVTHDTAMKEIDTAISDLQKEKDNSK